MNIKAGPNTNQFSSTFTILGLENGLRRQFKIKQTNLVQSSEQKLLNPKKEIHVLKNNFQTSLETTDKTHSTSEKIPTLKIN
jgi:hypothetical protein